MYIMLERIRLFHNFPNISNPIHSFRLTWHDEHELCLLFQRALDAGEMPALQPFVFTTDYSPSDWATMLQSGGVQLLDVQSVVLPAQLDVLPRHQTIPGHRPRLGRAAEHGALADA